MKRWLAWMGCVALLGSLAGCAPTTARSGNGSGNSVVDGLYAQLRQATSQYDQALEQARRGDTATSQRSLESALDELRSASDRCVNTAGCDTARFLSAYDSALRLKDGSFIGTEDLGDDSDDDTVAGSDSGVIATLPEARRTVRLLHDHKLSDIVSNNPTVQAALQVWLTRMRPNLIRAYVDYQYLRYQMWPAFHQAGLPEAILFGVMAKESGGNVHAISRSGAAGPLQFMPATGARFGLNTIDGFDQRFDPTMAARATAAYFNQELGALNDNLALAIAAYNGGEGRVGRLASADPDASFWNPDIYFALPPETRDYVPMVLAAAWLFLHPARYNLKFPTIDGAPGHVALASPASLNELTVCLGDDDGSRFGWYRTLRNLNPAMDPSQVQPVGTAINLPKFLEGAYRRGCVTGKWVALAQQLEAAQPPAPPERIAAADPPPVRSRRTTHYRVRKGDSLYAIAKRFDCDSVREIVRSNRLHSASDIHPGKNLVLVGCKR